MNNNYKPTGYNSVSPYFILDDAQQFIEMTTAIFSATELRRYEGEDGVIKHAELKIDDSVIMLSSANESFPAIQVILHVYVPDAAATYQKAISLGCKGIEEPANRSGDPDIRGTFIDLSGNMWSVGTQIPV